MHRLALQGIRCYSELLAGSGCGHRLEGLVRLTARLDSEQEAILFGLLGKGVHNVSIEAGKSSVADHA